LKIAESTMYRGLKNYNLQFAILNLQSLP